MNGYLTIDLEGRNLGDSEQKPLEGLYDKVTKSKKPVVFFNYVIGDNDQPGIPFYANILSPGTGGYIITILYKETDATFVPLYLNKNDTITITS